MNALFMKELKSHNQMVREEPIKLFLFILNKLCKIKFIIIFALLFLISLNKFT